MQEDYGTNGIIRAVAERLERANEICSRKSARLSLKRENSRAPRPRETSIAESRAVSPAISLVSRRPDGIFFPPFLLLVHQDGSGKFLQRHNSRELAPERAHIGDFDTRRCDRSLVFREFPPDNVGQVSGILPTGGKTSSRRTGRACRAAFSNSPLLDPAQRTPARLDTPG